MKTDKRLRALKCSANKKMQFEANACIESRKFAGSHYIASVKFMITSLAFLLKILFNWISIWANFIWIKFMLANQVCSFSRRCFFFSLGRWRYLASPAKCEQQKSWVKDKATMFLLLWDNDMSITNCNNSVSFRLTKKASHLSERDSRVSWISILCDFRLKFNCNLTFTDVHRLADDRRRERERETR